MFTDDPYSSRHEDFEMTPVSQTSSMLAMAPNEPHKAGDLSESFPLMNALVVKQQLPPEYPNLTHNESTSMSVSFTLEHSPSGGGTTGLHQHHRSSQLTAKETPPCCLDDENTNDVEASYSSTPQQRQIEEE